jgi:hypothetical protein
MLHEARAVEIIGLKTNPSKPTLHEQIFEPPCCLEPAFLEPDKLYHDLFL